MTKLNCSVESCAYNSNNCCERSDIHVAGEGAKSPSETNCSSFAPKKAGMKNSTGSACKDTKVACDAVTCRHNSNRLCNAGSIGIIGSHANNSRETECKTFAS